MKEANKKYEAYENNYGINLKYCKLLGEGHHGKVYTITDDRVIKVCKDSKSCIYEAFILTRTEGSIHFPKLYEFDEHIIIRDYVGGESLQHYIKKKGLSKRLCLNLLELLEEFKTLGFTKLDIRCKDIMVQENEFLMVIDPKSCFTRRVNYPRHLMKGLEKLGVLDIFLSIIREVRPDLYLQWMKLREESKSLVTS